MLAVHQRKIPHQIIYTLHCFTPSRIRVTIHLEWLYITNMCFKTGIGVVPESDKGQGWYILKYFDSGSTQDEV